MATNKLTGKEQRFVAEYLVDLNGARAARAAGYSAKAAKELGYRLLTKAHIQRAIQAGKARQLETAELSATRVLEELRRLAFADLRGFYDERNNLKPITELTPEQGSVLAGAELILKNAKAGDGVVDEVLKIKLWDKTRALELLAKHFNLLIENVNVTGDAELVARLTGARKRTS
jgi:phage terminase small subunit